MPFIKRFNPKYHDGWVHNDVCRRLERFSKAVAEGKSPRLMILFPPRHGKACAVGTLVPTPQGFQRIESLRPGDFVFGRNGLPTRVVAVSEIWRNRELFEAVTDDGASVVVDAEHEWTVRLCRKHLAYKTKTTRYLAERSSPRAPALMTYSPVAYPEAALPIHPYVLGAWLGDGTAAHATLTQGAQDYDFIRTEIELCGHSTTDRSTVGTFGIQDMHVALHDLRLIRNKHIPEVYQRASVQQRLALLQGLVDTDGYVAPDGQIEICSVNAELSRHILQLVRSLGVKASLIHGDATLNGRLIGPRYRVLFYMAGAARLPRKAARCRDNARTPHRFLTFRPAGRGDTVCIQVEAEDHQYLVGHGYLLTHNSEIASRNFPPWHLGQYPDHEFIACSYNLSLAMDFSRKVKGILEDPLYHTVFDTRLDPNNQSSESWGVHRQRGGYVAAGIGGPITGKGANCLAGDTQIATTRGNIPVHALYRLNYVPEIVTPLGPRRALAITKRPAPQMYEVQLASGAVLRATGQHPIYVPDRAAYVSVEQLYGEAKSSSFSGVRVVREVVSAATVRPQQVVEKRVDRVLLQPGVQPSAPCNQKLEKMSDLLEAGYGDEKPQREVLFDSVHAASTPPRAEDLPSVQRGISAAAFEAGLLRGDLRQYGARNPYAWREELELADGQRIRVLVRPDEADDSGARQRVRSVYGDARPVLPPHRREPQQQRPGEFADAVPQAPHGAPQVCYDTISVVRCLGRSENDVYDLQVEEAGCFFADTILVGNCLVIDDPVKNAEEADSADTREKIWEWYLSTAYSRLAPGGGVLVIQTHWHDDDLAGRLQTMMRDAAAGEGDYIDKFEVIKYPAIAEADEWLNHTTDLIEYDPPTEALAAPDAHYTLLRHRGDALHPERYDIDKLLRIKAQNKGGRWWSALYQQNPVPDDGSYFTKDQFRRAPLPSPKTSNILIAWDFAISEKKQNDFTVGTVLLQDSDDMVHVADQVRFRSGDAFFIVEAILNLAQKWHNPSLVTGFEDGQIYRAIEALLKKRMRERQFYPPTMVLKPISDKMARGRALQGRMQQGMISFNASGEWYDTLRAEMLRFPAGAHDDQVDSLAWAVQMVVGREPPRKPAGEKIKSWKDKLQSDGVLSHMVA